LKNDDLGVTITSTYPTELSDVLLNMIGNDDINV